MSSFRLETSHNSIPAPSSRGGKRKHSSKPLGPTKPDVLSHEDQELLKRLLITISKGERSIERQRQLLASLSRFEPHSAFQRIDRDQDGLITSLEILKFLRDNGVEEANEADTHYIVRYFDSNDDEMMNYEDLMQMVMPCDDQYLRAAIAQRDIYEVLKHDYLETEIEAELTRLFEKEIALNRVTEEMKQEMCSSKSFDVRRAFEAIDDWQYGFIDKKNLKSFLRKHNYIASTAECMAIIRRLDVDADARLSKQEFANGLRPEEPYSKTLKRSQRKRSKSTGYCRNSRLPKTGIATKGGQQTLLLKQSQRDEVRTEAFDRQHSKGGFKIGTTPLKSRPVVQQDLSMFTSPQSKDRRLNDSRSRRQHSRRRVRDDFSELATVRSSRSIRRINKVGLNQSHMKRHGSAIAGGRRKKDLPPRQAHQTKDKPLRLKSSRSRRKLKRQDTMEDDMIDRLAKPVDHSLLIQKMEREERQAIKRSRAEALGLPSRSRSAKKLRSTERVGGKTMLKKYKSFVRHTRKAENLDHQFSVDSEDNWRGPSDFTKISFYDSKERDERNSSRESRKQRNKRSGKKRKLIERELEARELSQEQPRKQLNEGEKGNTDLLKGRLNQIKKKLALENQERKPVFSKQGGATSPGSGQNLVNILPRADEGFFIRSLHEIIQFEKDFEQDKVNLSLREDFNLIDAFGVLDHDGKGNINPQELHVSLRRLDIPVTQEDCYLVFHRLNRDMDGLLKYSEFTAAFMPVDQHCARQLGSKRLQYCHAPNSSAFCYETMKHYCRVWHLLVRIEQQVEQIKDKLLQRPTFNIDSAFRSLDQNFSGQVTQADIKSLMLEYSMQVSSEDLQLLVYRLDKDKDSKVTFLEFKQAFTPQRHFIYQFQKDRPLTDQELMEQMP